jgi:MoxR-like ATPase
VIPVPALMVVSASNHLPEEEALRALFDRFLLRVPCENVPGEQLAEVLHAGWKWEMDRTPSKTGISIESLRNLQRGIALVDLTPMRSAYVALIQRLRTAGMAVSDRRAVKLQRVIAASALLCGRLSAEVSDLWVLRHIWDTQEQQSLLASLVKQALVATEGNDVSRMHPRAKHVDRPDPEQLAREIRQLADQADAPTISDADRSILRDKLELIAGRCEWVTDSMQRAHLQQEIATVWKRLGGPA